jgi:hypothetical protein
MCEFGVYAGGSLEIIATHNPTTEIIGIDSFQGLPPESKHDFHKEGDFADVNYHRIAGYFGMIYPRVRLFRGFSPDVFKAMDDNVRFSFVHVDVDLYNSVKHALDFFLPRMLTGGIMLFDDYKVRSTPGCEIAIREFFETAEIKPNHMQELFFWDYNYHPEEDHLSKPKSHNQFLIVR